MNNYFYSPYFYFINKTNNRIVRKSTTIDLSQDHYSNQKNNSINDILNYISPKRIYNPRISINNNLKNNSNNLILNKNKNLFSKNSSKSHNFFSFDNQNTSFEDSSHNNIFKYKNKYIRNNYNKVFNSKYNHKVKNKLYYSKKLSKQEKIMDKISKLKSNFNENQINSFIDNDCHNKNYRNTLRSNFIWNKFNTNSNSNKSQIYKKFSENNSNKTLIKDIDYLKKQFINGKKENIYQ